MMPSMTAEQVRADLDRYNHIYFGSFHAMRESRNSALWIVDFKGDYVTKLRTAALVAKVVTVGDDTYYGFA